jgi:hypothetical protein
MGYHPEIRTILAETADRKSQLPTISPVVILQPQA